MTRLLLTVAATALLAACQTPGTATPEVASAHVPTVTRTIYIHDMANAGDGFTVAEIAELNGWLDSLNVGYGDRLSLEQSSTVGAYGRQQAVNAELAKRGLALSDLSPTTGPAPAAGTSRFVLIRADAVVENCPDFTRLSNPEYQASKTSNYGCANASNLAAMVADSNDLIHGKPHGGVSAERVVKGIEAAAARTTRESVNSAVGSVE